MRHEAMQRVEGSGGEKMRIVAVSCGAMRREVQCCAALRSGAESCDAGRCGMLQVV